MMSSRTSMQPGCFCAVVAVIMLAIRGAAAQPVLLDSNLVVEHVASGLSSAATLTMCFTFVDADTVLAVERSEGLIYRIDLIEGQTVGWGATVHDLDIISADPNDSQSEYGIQGIAAHPDSATNHYIYVKYDRSPTAGIDTPQSVVAPLPNFSASSPTQNVIERYIWNPKANGGDGSLSFDSSIHSVTFDTRYHHGGPIVLDSSGRLFTSYGDLRHLTPTWVPGHNGQFLSSNIAGGQIANAGTIIRLNSDGSIPAGNPFVGSSVPGAAAWYSYGVRNSYGLAIDPATGTLWSTDNGEDSFDEINRVFAGFNSGHSRIMGAVGHPQQEGSIDDLVVLSGSQYADPSFSWLDTIGITGISFLHGSALGAAYNNRVLVGMFNTGFLWSFRLNANRTGFTFNAPDLQDLVDDRPTAEDNPIGTPMQEVFLGDGFGSFFSGILSIQRAPDGHPYILTIPGDLYRISHVPVAGDINGDIVVNFSDVLAVIAAWGSCGACAACPADVTGDCTVNIADLLFVIAHWG